MIDKINKCNYESSVLSSCSSGTIWGDQWQDIVKT